MLDVVQFVFLINVSPLGEGAYLRGMYIKDGRLFQIFMFYPGHLFESGV